MGYGGFCRSFAGWRSRRMGTWRRWRDWRTWFSWFGRSLQMQVEQVAELIEGLGEFTYAVRAGNDGFGLH